jgi:hypothetical protein
MIPLTGRASPTHEFSARVLTRNLMMPLLKREQILAQLELICAPGSAEEILAQALALAGLPTKRLYKPEEVSLLGYGLMTRAQALLDANVGVNA